MNVRASLLLCVLALGCSDAATAPASSVSLDGRKRVAPDEAASSWTVRRQSAVVSEDTRFESPMRDAGITQLPQVKADGGVFFPDAGRPIDAGRPMEPDEEDAGSEEPPPCSSSYCLCNRICERGLALECELDDPLDLCIELCDAATSDCYEELLRVLRCKVALPDAAYSCDPDFLAFTVEGCVAESATLQACRGF